MLRLSHLLSMALLGLSLIVGCTPGTVEPTQSERPSLDEIRAEYQVALAKAQATNGPGSPALWSLADEDTTIYMFGTVHLLRPELEWRYPIFDEALAAADTVIFEVDMESPEAQQALMTDFMARGMYQDGRTLREVLNEADEAVIEAAMDKVGVPLDAFNTQEPWMAGISLVAMKMVADGFDPNSGVEKVIQADAQTMGKAFAYLESISEQADAFDLLPEEAQIELLYGAAIGLDDSAAMLDDMVAEWADGDVAGLGILVADPDGMGFSKAMYDSVLVERNRKWIPRIEALLEDPGTVLVAVGSGHFAGPDSVILMLEDKGYTVERLN
ncbi:TraB/GumN family protein [Hyphomonas sp. FCG-A18]|uniref:TraB/GumN family protein n=1 Tax=Hyphomonas sp. FCG-A18 TaxID=3080019 RepID=UPI002B2EBAD3|nr:TraB/GumN family protein [Hyphomonas sp. FCG-A18]